MLNKLIEKPIKQKCFFIELQLNIKDTKNELIEEIEKGVLLNNNMNNRTNVKGQMTCWNYFNHNIIFHKVFFTAMDEINKYLNLPKFFLEESWGIKINRNNFTNLHNHGNKLYSGILYLNDSEEPIKFPEYNLEIVPKEGKFLLFSALLKHSVDVKKSDIPKYAIPFNCIEAKLWD